MSFKELLLRAKDSDTQATDALMAMYRPLLIKESILNGVFDEDLYQEFWLTFVACVRKFRI